MKAVLAAAAAALASASISPQTGGSGPLAIAASDSKLQWGPCPPIFKGQCSIAVLHGDPAKPNADIFLRVGGGTKLTPHRHTSAERMVLVSGRLRVDYEGAPPAMLAVGDYAYGPAGLPHKASCVGRKTCTLFIAFEGPVDAVAFEGPL